jgi:hypothetical protein
MNSPNNPQEHEEEVKLQETSVKNFDVTNPIDTCPEVVSGIGGER